MRHQALPIVKPCRFLLQQLGPIEELCIEEIEIENTKFTVQMLSNIAAKPDRFAIKDHLNGCSLERLDWQVEVRDFPSARNISEKAHGVVRWNLFTRLWAVD